MTLPPLLPMTESALHPTAAPLDHGHGACCHGDAAQTHAPSVDPTRRPSRGEVARRAASNTAICLFGCSLGDVGVVVLSRSCAPETPYLVVMLLAILAGLATSISLETVWLMRAGHRLGASLRLALSMSLISMIAMEITMNVVDLGLSGGMRMQLPWISYLGILAIGEVAGFLVAFPYNAWRLLTTGRACH